MKHLLLAAAAIVAAPALAQTTPATPDQSTTSAPPPADASQPMQTPPDTATTGTPTDTTTPPAATADGSTPQQMPMQQTGSTGDMGQASMANGAGDPVGGYQPSQPALSGAPQPGATVVFRPAQTPDQAYPAPAPLASYPVCKPGQFDNCMQGRGSTHSRQVRRRR